MADIQNIVTKTTGTGAKSALIGGLLAAMVALSGYLIVGEIYSRAEARHLLEAMAPSVRTLCFAIMTASSTILALMLTILSFTYQAETEFDDKLYKQIKFISLLSTIALATATLLLLFVSIPLQEGDGVSQAWFKTIYYVLIVCSAGLSGLVVMIVLMLFNTVRSTIQGLNISLSTKQER